MTNLPRRPGGVFDDVKSPRVLHLEMFSKILPDKVVCVVMIYVGEEDGDSSRAKDK